MGNCFIKKYRGELSGLTDKVGELTLIVKANTQATDVYNRQFTIRSWSTCTIYCEDSSKFFEVNEQRVNSYTFTNKSVVIKVDNDDYIIRVTNKHTLSALGGAQNYQTIVYYKDIDALKENQVFVNITCNPFEDGYPVGNINALNYQRLQTANLKYAELEGSINDLTDIGSNVTYFKVKGKKLKGDISVFGNCINISSNYFDIAGTTELEGKIQDLANLTKLTRADFIANNPKIKGSIDAYITGNCNASTNPRTSYGNHTSGIYFGGDILSKCTFNGDNHISLGHDFIGWDSSSKMYVLTGSTYNTKDHVYCKGYTQQEAETAFSGKTIVRVDA